MKPTTEQVREEIRKLRDLKLKVKAFTYFGDDNTAAIQAQIDVLQNGMDEDEIYDKWNIGEEDAYQRNSALTALQWYENGETEDGEKSLSEGWEGLVQ